MDTEKNIGAAVKGRGDALRNEKFKNNVLNSLPFWIAAFFAGILAVLYTRLFAGAEKITDWLLTEHKWWMLVVSPALFILSVWLVRRFAPYSQGSGIPQIMAGIELANPKDNFKVDKLLSVRVIIVKICSSLVMLIGGGAIGREGPTIQISGSVFRIINKITPSRWPKISRRNMIMTGAAAGLAAAFNTPLGGIMFALEELTKTHISYFRISVFSGVIIAGLTAQYYLGSYLYLGYPDVSHLSSTIFLWVALIAVVTGLAGSALGKLMVIIFHWKSRFTNLQTWIYVGTCALIMAVVAITFNPEILGSGKNLMNNLLFINRNIEWYVPILRFAGPLFSFTTGAAGGVFAPSLSAGASIGALFSGWFSLSDTDTNLVILAGMVGFLTGVTRTPFTSAILVLEMTDRHNVIFELMLAGMVSSVISLLIDKHSLYDHLKVQYLRRLENETHPGNIQPVAPDEDDEDTDTVEESDE